MPLPREDPPTRGGQDATTVLITGMSAVGKSSVVDELRRRNYEAVDLDDPEWSEYRYPDPHSDDSEPRPEWLWREDRVERLLTSHGAGTMFVAGCAANQGRFYPLFDRVVLLTAGESVTRYRLASRTTNDFGKAPGERAKVLSDKATFEQRLRIGADLVIDTEAPFDSVIEAILESVFP